jgi:hypothetical protein
MIRQPIIRVDAARPSIMEEHPRAARRGGCLTADAGPPCWTATRPVPRRNRRPREVPADVAHGGSGREISRIFAVSAKTVKSHVSAILSKLGVPHRTQAALPTVHNGMVDTWVHLAYDMTTRAVRISTRAQIKSLRLD